MPHKDYEEVRERFRELTRTLPQKIGDTATDIMADWWLAEMKAREEKLRMRVLSEAWPGMMNSTEPEDDYQRGWNEALDTYRDNIRYQLSTPNNV